MKIFHCFVKGVFIGAYTSFWGALTLAIIVMPLTLLWLGMSLSDFWIEMTSTAGYGVSFVCGAGMLAFMIGLFFPVIPLVVAGTIAVCFYNKNSKVKSWLLAILVSFIALSLAMSCLGSALKAKFSEVIWYLEFRQNWGRLYP